MVGFPPDGAHGAGRLPTGRAVVLVPVKAFAAAKGRLAGVLDGPGRAALARSMAEVVVAAAAPLPVVVVCDDDDVAVAAGIERLLQDRETRKRLGEAAKARSRAFDIETMSTRMLDVYRSVLAETASVEDAA